MKVSIINHKKKLFDFNRSLFVSNTESLRIVVSDKYGNEWEIKLGDETGDFVEVSACGKNKFLQLIPKADNSIRIL
jgi:hypothetical protein